MQPSPEQAAAIASPAPRLLLRAGAGSGKSFVLVRRIAQAIANGADPAKVVAISFTVQAGRILADRLAALGITGLRHVGTIHALCLAESHKWSSWGKKRPTIVDEEYQRTIIKEELARLRLNKKVSIADVCATLAAGQVSKPGAPISNPAVPAAIAVRGRLLFAGQASMDLLMGEATVQMAHNLVADLEEEEFALDALFWDEFQDTSAGDFAILKSLEFYTENITVVGDEMQSIFGFRGSSPDYFRHLAASPDWQQLTLADNYRSLPPIIAAANRLTAGQAGAIAMNYVRDPRNASTMFVAPEIAHTPVSVCSFGTEAAEFAHIREWLDAKHERRHDGSQPTVAILCRHNALAERLRLALADALPPSPALALDPAMVRQAMAAVQHPGETWHDHHDALPYVRHFSEACGSSQPEALLPAMAEALAQAEAQASYDHGGLYIGTVHGAKGLEWDHVLIAGAEQASWPDTAEMLRLFYVAVTRARDSLTITAARRRPSLHGRGWTESEMASIVGKL
jgi:DNA helicase-2/ATP-dependent DNA helicase PcrA